MKPLVSILIPAYNAEKWIGYTLQSAIDQTWPRKEIIVVNDGSTDATPEVVRAFASRGVFMISTPNQGQSAALNYGFRQSQGEYIQWLDSDDLLAPNKIERQIASLSDGASKRTLLSSTWASFYFRAHRARFVHNSLCQDLSPIEWLLRKMGENLHMGNSTWLVSRELTEAAGPWDERLMYDQDGEYFARVLLASEGTHFVPETGIFYRVGPLSRMSYIGNSDLKKDSLLRSMKLHVQYLRSLEESDRVRKACLAYLHSWRWAFYLDRPDAVLELQALAAQLGGRLESFRLNWKYAWMEPVVGRRTARRVQESLSMFKDSCFRLLDNAMYNFETRLGL